MSDLTQEDIDAIASALVGLANHELAAAWRRGDEYICIELQKAVEVMQWRLGIDTEKWVKIFDLDPYPSAAPPPTA